MNTLLEELRNTTVNMQNMTAGEARVISIQAAHGIELSIRIIAGANGVRFDCIPKSSSNEHQMVALKGMKMSVVEGDIYSLDIQE